MEFHKHVLPFLIAGGAAGTWYLTRGNRTATAATVPNPSSSGVTGPSTTPTEGVATDVQPVRFKAVPADLYPNPYSVLAQPYSAFPGQQTPDAPPPFMAFNFGPAFDLTRDAAPLDVSGTDQQNVYMDGGGDTLLSSSRARQVLSEPGWLNSAITNINSFLTLEMGAPPSPTLQSVQPSGSLN